MATMELAQVIKGLKELANEMQAHNGLPFDLHYHRHLEHHRWCGNMNTTSVKT